MYKSSANDLGTNESSHQEDHEAAGYYESAAEDYSVVGNLLEENQRNRLRHDEEDRDVDAHQAVEIDAGLIDQDAVRKQHERTGCYQVARPAQPDSNERIAADFKQRGQHEYRESL